MEPLKIEINLGKETRECLLEVSASIAAGLIAIGGRKEDFLRAVSRNSESEKEFRKESEPEKESKQEPEKEPIQEPEPDLPADISDPISDEAVIAEVAETKKTVAPKVIRELFDQYGIPCSTKCPQDKRAALIADLKKLRDAQ